jgi:hypothetical protein
MRLFTPTPANIRAVAIGLTALAHLLALLLLSIERRMSRREPVQELLQFVSIWPDSPPPEQLRRTAPARPRSTRLASTPLTIAPIAAPQVPAANLSPEPTARPPVDWARERQEAAARVAADFGKPDTFSPPPNTDLPAKLCAPRTPDKVMQAKMDALLPPPPEPFLPPAGPSGSVMMPGGVRVGIVGFGALSGALSGKGAARSDPLAFKDKQPESSVPDPNTCD